MIVFLMMQENQEWLNQRRGAQSRSTRSAIAAGEQIELVLDKQERNAGGTAPPGTFWSPDPMKWQSTSRC